MKQHYVPAPAGSFSLALELNRRMQESQRHRLLHGYPLTSSMSIRKYERQERGMQFESPSIKSLLVGVLPHPFCNPAVRGCGFCTFPHQPYSLKKAEAVVGSVIMEIKQKMRAHPELRGREVVALYFGGGTANLIPPESFRRLCRQLTKSFNLSNAEVTLEGVPAYFAKRRPLLMDILSDELPARLYRISMGIQTFSEYQLQRMGRLAFGNLSTFQEVVKMAHRRGFTVSGDFLCNLPNQTINAMRKDVTQAAEIGLDHLGLYNLVLFSGLGTEWSKDKAQLAGIPTNERAVDNWLELRQLLFSQGFRQNTLTNFERLEFENSDNRFIYEELSFKPDTCEAVGFGPTAISFSANLGFQGGWKTLNPEFSDDYRKMVSNNREAWVRYFQYDPWDLRILYITRRLAALSIDRSRYRQLFGSELIDDFADELAVLQSKSLLNVTSASICPTPKGMFYADSIAGLLASRKLKPGRYREEKYHYQNDNAAMHM